MERAGLRVVPGICDLVVLKMSIMHLSRKVDMVTIIWSSVEASYVGENINRIAFTFCLMTHIHYKLH